MRRREFITLIGGLSVVWPSLARAQQARKVPLVGVLMPFEKGDEEAERRQSAFQNGLEQFGWRNGQNIRIEYRWAGGDPNRYQSHAAELVGLAADVILANATPILAAVRAQTHTIPIVFVQVIDPVSRGFVNSLARPGGNITGFGVVDAPIMGKWLQLLKEVAPKVTRVGIIFNPDTAPYSPLFTREIEAAASSFGTTVRLFRVHDDAVIEEAIAAQAREPRGGLICLPDSFSVTHAGAIVAAATRHGLPLIGLPPLVRAGGLMSYFFDPIDAHAQAASYIDRILRGASPADLPVQQPTKFSLIINLKTAKALGLTVPPSMLDLADEVIERKGVRSSPY